MSRIAKCNYQMPNGRKCGAIAVISIPCRDRGGRSQCFCERHNPANMWMEGYNTENATTTGERPDLYKGMTCSMEVETMRPSALAYAEFSNLKFIPSHDGTVDCEFKSPIYASLKSPVRITKSIQRFIDDGDIAITHEDCGTHFHCGLENDGMIPLMPVIRRMYHSLFVPLCEAMQENETATEAIFGRRLAYWAKPINMNTDEMEHRNFVNVQHKYSIEWRIMFFENASQYASAMMLCRNMTLEVINYAERMNTLGGLNAPREIRKAEADKVAKKLVKMFNKAAAKIR